MKNFLDALFPVDDQLLEVKFREWKKEHKHNAFSALFWPLASGQVYEHHQVFTWSSCQCPKDRDLTQCLKATRFLLAPFTISLLSDSILNRYFWCLSGKRRLQKWLELQLNRTEAVYSFSCGRDHRGSWPRLCQCQLCPYGSVIELVFLWRYSPSPEICQTYRMW